MQTILFKTFLDNGHEKVDARVMMRPEIVNGKSIYEDSLYDAIARSEKEVKRG